MTVEPSNSLPFYMYNPGYTTIENEIFWKGVDDGWEKYSLKVWGYFCKKSNVILDIGANTGIYSLIANSINSSASIQAFEPVERTSILFQKNLDLNQPNNIIFHKKAVSNITGTALFYDVNTPSQYSASLNEKMLHTIEGRISYRVDVVDLDNYASIKDLKVDLIKLDVEMHELEALQGMSNLIINNRPVLLIEILTEGLGNEIMRFFEKLNYLYFNIDEEKGITVVSKITKSNTYNYLLLPEERYTDYKKMTF
jgi:FkbM family methyltransferase